MVGKILIAYASKYGSTAEIASAIGDTFVRAGMEADVRFARDVKEIAPYRGIVIGTPIRAGKPLGDAVAFAKRFRAGFAGKRVAVFSAGVMMRDDTPENRVKAREVLAPILTLTGEPDAIGFFAGTIDYKKIGFPLSFIFKREPSGTMREGDWRDWDMIRKWAADIAALWKE